MPHAAPESGPSRTRGWGFVGLSLLAIAFVLYFLTFVLGVGIAVVEGEDADGRLMLATIGAMMLSGLAGFAILFAKVVVDRMTNAEDRFYSRNVEK